MDYVVHIWISERILSNGEQIIVPPIKVVKSLQKIGIIWPVEHAFVWDIAYKQGATSMSVRIRRKENIKVFMKNWLVRFIQFLKCGFCM
jgi:hypothetical protein